MVDQAAHDFLLLVNMIKGTRANAMPNESTTWLITSALDGFTPHNIMSRGGTVVMTLLK